MSMHTPTPVSTHMHMILSRHTSIPMDGQVACLEQAMGQQLTRLEVNV